MNTAPSNFLIEDDEREADRQSRALRAALSECQEAKRAMEVLLREKEALLQEVQHRVKNNLQIVSGLLRLQAKQATDPALIAGFTSAWERVHAMAAVHDRLYAAGDFAVIDLGAHLGRMVRLLTLTHAPAGLRCAPQLETVEVDLDTALSLSLATNELVVNAAKHAYLGRSDGVLQIELRAGVEQHELRIADDGPGLPAGVELATARTLGLRLVRDLAVKIRAEVQIDSTMAGTSIVIRWAAQPRVEPTNGFRVRT